MLPIVIKGRLICRSVWLAVMVLVSTHGRLQAMVPASSANINFDADIVRSTCRVDGLAGWLSLGAVKPEDITTATFGEGSAFSPTGGEVKIKITCDGLKKANASFSAKSAACPKRTLGGWTFSCGDPKQTVGIMPKVRFLTSGGVEQYVLLKNDLDSGRTYGLKVDSGVASLTISEVYLARLIDTPVEYGNITASFGIKITSD